MVGLKIEGPLCAGTHVIQCYNADKSIILSKAVLIKALKTPILVLVLILVRVYGQGLT